MPCRCPCVVTLAALPLQGPIGPAGSGGTGAGPAGPEVGPGLTTGSCSPWLQDQAHVCHLSMQHCSMTVSKRGLADMGMRSFGCLAHAARKRSFIERSACQTCLIEVAHSSLSSLVSAPHCAVAACGHFGLTFQGPQGIQGAIGPQGAQGFQGIDVSNRMQAWTLAFANARHCACQASSKGQSLMAVLHVAGCMCCRLSASPLPT